MNVFIVSFNDGWKAWKEFVRFKLGEKIQLWISYKWEFNNDVSNTTHRAFVLNFLLNLVNSLAKKRTITSNTIRPIKIKKSIRRIWNVDSYEYVRFFRFIAPRNDNSPKHISTLTNLWEIVSSAFLCQDVGNCDSELTVKLNDSICHWKRPSVAKVLFVFHRRPGLTLHACLVSVHGRFFVRQSVRAYACARSSFHQKERRGSLSWLLAFHTFESGISNFFTDTGHYGTGINLAGHDCALIFQQADRKIEKETGTRVSQCL